MLKTKTSLLASALALALSAGTANAAVSAEQAAKLGAELTPSGAPRAAQGNIPAWEGDSNFVVKTDDKGKLLDPFPAAKPKFVITAANYKDFAANLTDGQQAMFAKYPDTYRMPVYETRRVASLPVEVDEETKKNATNTSLVESGNGVVNFTEGVAFPFPQNGLEAIWNHITRYRGGSIERTITQLTPQVNGDFTVVKFRDEFTFRNRLKDYDPAKDQNVLFYFKQDVLEPARLAGNVLLVHETLDQVKEARRAWLYNAGQRRVRRAPNVAYDGPGTASDGQRTADNFDLYNGSPDKYDWKLDGLQEMYIPYNSYRLASPELEYEDIVKAGHIDQDLTRYELHRVWKVTATLKDGARHIYNKRVFYIDEDTWQASAIDHYDARGQLWRVAEAHNMFHQPKQIPSYAAEVLYDLLNGRYIVTGLNNEERVGYKFDFERRSGDYTPAALRRSGKR